MMLGPIEERATPRASSDGLATTSLSVRRTPFFFIASRSVMKQERNYLSFNEVIELYPISRGALRRYLLNREHNGLAAAVIRPRRKLIIHRQRFEAWLESFSEGTGSTTDQVNNDSKRG